MNPYELIAEFRTVVDSILERDPSVINLTVSANPQTLTVSFTKQSGESMNFSVPRVKAN